MIVSKEDFTKYSLLSCDKNFNQNFGFFVRLLRRSRLPFLKTNRLFMSAIQMNMVRHLSYFQECVRKTKKEVKEASSVKDKDFSNQKMLILKEWIRVFQTITDGIAWRNLKFNRPIIRLMSENNSVGHMGKEEVDIYTSYLRHSREFIIINDLTRCLRISDITKILSNGKVVLLELKKSGKLQNDVLRVAAKMKKNKRFFTKQELKQWVAQWAIIDNKITVPLLKNGVVSNNLKAEIISSDIDIKNHFSKIRQLIKSAKKNGYSQEEVEEGYFIKVIFWDRYFVESEKNDDYQIKYGSKPGWIKNNKKILNFSNYDSFRQEEGQYTRNIIPYSVLPFSSKDAVYLMMGHIFIEEFINLDLFKKRFENDGWQVKEPDIFCADKYEPIKEMNKFEDMDKYDRAEEQYVLSKSIDGNRYFCEMPFTLVLIMMTSFYKIDFLIDAANFLFSRKDNCNSKSHPYTINFAKEYKNLI